MKTFALVSTVSVVGLASLMACSSSSSTTSSGADGGAADASPGAEGGSMNDGGAGGDAGSSDGGGGGTDGGSIVIGTVTVSSWDDLQVNGRIATDNAGTTVGGTESNASVNLYAAGSTTAKAGPTGLGFVTLGLAWDGVGNVFAATGAGTFNVLMVAPGGAKFGPSAFTGNATGGLYRDRGGSVYAWEQSSSAVAGKLSRTTGGSAAFTALPAFPTVVSLNDLSSGPDGTAYAAIIAPGG